MYAGGGNTNPAGAYGYYGYGTEQQQQAQQQQQTQGAAYSYYCPPAATGAGAPASATITPSPPASGGYGTGVAGYPTQPYYGAAAPQQQQRQQVHPVGNPYEVVPAGTTTSRPPPPPTPGIVQQQQQQNLQYSSSAPTPPLPQQQQQMSGYPSNIEQQRQLEREAAKQTQRQEQQQYQDRPREQQHQMEVAHGGMSMLARRPPKRAVQLSSAPNPIRDIYFTDVPKEYKNSSNMAPLSVVGFVGVDDGNANPKFLRCTCGSAPSEARIVKDTHTPFGAVVSPLCRPLFPSEEVPIVSDRAPVRCHRCRGYLSCHARFTEMGRNWTCPLCGMANAVDDQNFCNLDTKGKRLDKDSKPELCKGSVEYDVTDIPEYALRSEKDEIVPTRPLHHLFLIDVSKQALATFLPDYIEAIRAAVGKMAEVTPQCRVAFITFGARLHFYNVRHPKIPQLCVPDVNNPFVPLPFGSYCWLEVGADRDCIFDFLARIPSYAADLSESGCALGAAVKAAMLALAGQHGGRVIMCAHRYPQIGLGAILPREQHKLYGTEKEKELLRPIDGFWTSTATAAAKQQISFDLFLFASEYSELVTLSQLSHVTNGSVFSFSSYDPQVDNTKVSARMLHLLTEEAGYGGILRVRCSSGLRISRYLGHFLSETVNDMDLASITSSSTFFAEVVHEGKLDASDYAYLQAALLYTTRAGRRCVRVHSYRMPVVATLTGLFAEMDLEAVLLGIIQETVVDVVNKGPKHARRAVTDRVTNIMTGYRRYCVAKSDSTTLLMPSRLKLLPIYLLCFLKSDALVEGTTVSIDARVQNLYDLLCMPVQYLLPYLYPSLFALHHVVSDLQCGEINQATGKCILPPRRQLIVDSVHTSGIYALCDEQARLVYMWIGADVEPSVSQYLFQCPDARSVCRHGGPGEEYFHERLTAVLYALTLHEDGMRRLIVVHQGEPGEEAFFNQFKEEKSTHTMGHDQFLVLVHNAVRNALT